MSEGTQTFKRFSFASELSQDWKSKPSEVLIFTVKNVQEQESINKGGNWYSNQFTKPLGSLIYLHITMIL